jgi:hypothetical protein
MGQLPLYRKTTAWRFVEGVEVNLYTFLTTRMESFTPGMWIKTLLKERECEDVDWIYLAQDKFWFPFFAFNLFLS